MNAKTFAAIGLVYLLACAGWGILGTTTMLRSTEYRGRLDGAVERMWGVPLVQSAPSLSVDVPGSDRARWISAAKNTINVSLECDYRRKGLVWYPAYTCAFDGTYMIENTEQVGQKVRVHFDLPAKGGTYDDFVATVDGVPIGAAIDTQEGIGTIIELPPGRSADFRIAYKTRGMREWRYKMDANAGRVQNLELAVTTDFRNVDFPDGSLSPTQSEEAARGMRLRWAAADLITEQDVGVIVPERLNPGPVTSRITFFAPVCLIFFFVLTGTINIVYRVNIHPMHYLFVAAGFFAFHLLLVYMVDLIPLHVAFAIAATVSVALVTSYLAGALRGKFPWKVAAAGQLFFLVLFSYSFFLKGMTGLTVAIGSVVTLAILMRVTAHVDWSEAFAKGNRARRTADALPGGENA